MLLASLAALAPMVALQSRDLDARPFPRVGMLWSPYNGPGALWDKAGNYALVLIGTDGLGLRFKANANADMATEIDAAGVAKAKATIAKFYKEHPDSQVIVETYFFEANEGTYPADSPWWFRDDKGQKVSFWKGCYNMATDNPGYIKHIAKRIDAIAEATEGKTGLYLDNLRFDDRAKKGWMELLGLLRKSRPDRFIMANAGWDSDGLAWVLPQLNGIMYEDSVHHTADGDQEKFYARVAHHDSLMRKPTRSMVEIFGKDSDVESAWRELVRTLLYTDAGFLYADSTFGHRHAWRKEWSPLLGKAVDGHRTPNGQAQTRRFANGMVAWNPSRVSVTLELGGVYRDQRTQATVKKVTLSPGQGAYLVKE
ncbi:MAG: hypothetical protein JSS65_12400 [Armatimonadetes bacterium]|nr:hypothetical protein [Armatimonadota bacterium]